MNGKIVNRMNRKYKKKASESLDMWCIRLSKQIDTNKLTQEELCEVLHELSITSYIEGIKAQQEVNKKFKEIEEQKNELTRYRV
jgi:hypothetical protein